MEHNPNQQPATPEEIWDILRSVSTEQKKISRQQKETDRQMKETDRRIENRMKYLEHLFTGQWGKLMESLVEGDLVPLLHARKIDVLSTLTNVKGRINGEHYEYDILAVNRKVVVVVEVKTTLHIRHVKHFLRKLDRFTEHQPIFRGKQIYGAMAYLRVPQAAEVYAERQGLFVIRATGSSASIVNQADFQPRVFG